MVPSPHHHPRNDFHRRYFSCCLLFLSEVQKARSRANDASGLAVIADLTAVDKRWEGPCSVGGVLW